MKTVTYQNMSRNDKRYRQCYLASVCLLLMQLPLWGQTATHYKQYVTSSGLSDNFVTAMVQDSRGFLWLTTRYGINRFDGTRFKPYTTNLYPRLLRNDFSCSTIDSCGRVLCGAPDGVVVRYNPRLDDFDTLLINEPFSLNFVAVNLFYQSPSRGLFALTSSGLYKFDYNADAFVNNTAFFLKIKHLKVYDMHVDREGRYWLGASTGVYVFDGTGNELARYRLSLTNTPEIFTFESLSDSLLLIGSAVGGMWAVDLPKSGALAQPTSIDAPFPDVSCFFQTRTGRILVGTRSRGLWSMERKAGMPSRQSFQPENTSHKAINAIADDERGNLWLCTQGAGLVCYPAKQAGTVQHSSQFGFPATIVSSFVQDDAGAIWVGTDGDGLFKLSPGMSIAQQISTANTLPSNGILGLAKGTRNELWIATWGGGICAIDASNGRLASSSVQTSSLPINNVKSVFVSSDGTTWTATHGEGLCWLDKSSGKWKSHKNGAPPSFSFEPYPWLNQVLETKQGVMWVATFRNVWRMEHGVPTMVLSDTANHPMHLPLAINSLAANDLGEVFAATNRGLFKIQADGKDGRLLSFMPRCEYFGLCFDANGKCWVSGTCGLMRVDENQRTMFSIDVPNQCFAGNYFTSRAMYCDRSGLVYAGGVDGFLVFHPDSIDKKDPIRTIAFSDLHIASVKIKPGGEQLPVHLSCAKTLRLNHDHANLRIDLDVVSSGEPKCAYILEGIDNRWNVMGAERYISFTHIPPGNYVLRVKAWQGSNERGAAQASLNIVVSPPWWKTWWFRVLSIIVTVFLLMFTVWLRMQSVVRLNTKLEKLVDERTRELRTANTEICQQNKSLNEKQFVIEMKNEELSQALSTKDKLLSIVAHDLKNPMFAIVTLLDKLKRKFNEYDDAKKIQLIDNAHESSVLLQNEMGNLLEWATAQQRAVAYAPQPTDLHVVISDTVALLKQYAQEKEIEVRFLSTSHPVIVVDARMISTAIRNLIGNALKFTPRGGTIRVELRLSTDRVSIIVADSGVGMTDEQVQHCFDANSFASTPGTNNEKGSGLGLKICHEFVVRNKGSISVESAVGQGTSFTISLPVGDVAGEVPKDRDPHLETTTKSENSFEVNKTLLEGNTILVIDDNPVVRQHLVNIIGPYACVVEAEDGVEGLKIAIETQPDVIVSDVDMPRKDGMELCRDIAASPITAHIPVVILTARNQPINKLEGLHSGAIDYLTKPFNERELLIKLSNILAIRRNQQQRLLSKQLSKYHNKGDVHPFMVKFLEVVEQHYQNAELSVDDIAHELAMSKATMSRRLSSFIDKTPLEILNEYRLQKARELLANSSLNIGEVAVEVGFNDPRYFSRKFKDFFGESPSKIGEG